MSKVFRFLFFRIGRQLGQHLPGFGDAGAGFFRGLCAFGGFKNIECVMVAGQRLFQGFAVGGDFAFQIIGFGNFLLDARPVKRLPVSVTIFCWLR